jgi:hypothetical protein
MIVYPGPCHDGAIPPHAASAPGAGVLPGSASVPAFLEVSLDFVEVCRMGEIPSGDQADPFGFRPFRETGDVAAGAGGTGVFAMHMQVRDNPHRREKSDELF